MKKGFLAIEYAVLIAIIVAALIAMQGYIRKAISGRWRESADSIGFGMQYEPRVTRVGE
jgi:Flp pilus assembly pilin Flp